MTAYEERLRDAVSALTIHSPNVFSWFKRRNARPPARGAENAFELLRLRVRAQLYHGFYCRGIADPSIGASESDARARTSWMAALSAANCGSGCADRDWVLVEDRSHSMIVRKKGLTLEVSRKDIVSTSGSVSLTVRLPKELVGISPGFYVALGNEALPFDDASFRVYWNLGPRGARPFVASATQCLNERGIAFRLKVLADPRAYGRCDSAVLYFRKRDLATAYPAIERLLAAKAIERSALVPALTKAIAPGVAIAEQPRIEESFGQNRMGIMAAALVDAYRERERSFDARMARVLAAFGGARIDLTRPYLNHGSRDVYACLM